MNDLQYFVGDTHLAIFTAIPLTRAASTHEERFILFAALTQQI